MYFAPWKIVLIVVVCLAGLIFSAPNFLTAKDVAALPGWLPKQQINLGLDLRGGSHLLLEVDTSAVLKDRLEALVEGVRQELLRNARIGYTGLGIAGNTVTLKLRDPAQLQAALDAIKKLALPTGSNLRFGTSGTDISTTGTPDGTITIQLSTEAVRERALNAVQQSIEIVRRRIDQTGVNEPTIQLQGSDRILVQLPGLDDPERIKRLLGTTAKMVFRLVDTDFDPTSGAPVPPGTDILDADTSNAGRGLPQKYAVRKRVEVDGANLTDAQPTTDRESGQPVVSFKFDSIGAKRFAEITAANVGRPFAIVLDNKVITAPRINQPILGGSGQISGSFSFQEANDLSVLLRAGALPAPLKIIEERTVGPDLGADSIAAGVTASIIGFVLVVLFMLASYGLFGVFANVALLFNLFLIVGALSILQASLTLPGIAGILLTIGMAVDANVLINERIREESRLGKSPIAAIDAGFNRAFSTIFDANVTTIIKMAILFTVGAGPVRGFAVTIMLGIATSMFTAILLTRLLIMYWVRRRRPVALAV